MKKSLFIAFMLTVTFVNAQVDQIFKHNGETVKGKVIRVEEYTITFVYDGEDAEYTIGKYAVEKIIYGKSGRVEEVTDKIDVSGKDG
ncbi:MAG: hypothetical protein KDC68_06795, partial [Gelidibacter sp.]|nr:hypothetical protein [Gelidibacter sp.]